jgi:uncharacterized glyoxalase superfamily protein PhnB
MQNKNIPFYVKCFLDPSLSGTIIHNKTLKGLPLIKMPMNQTFWGSYFGVLTDKFGINWTVSFDAGNEG